MLGLAARLVRRPSVTALFDQLSLSGVNFVSVLLIARYCDKTEFAAYGLTLAIWAFCVSLQRSVIVLPMIVAGSDPDQPHVPGQWLWVNAAFLALVSAALGGAWLAFSVTEDAFATRALTLALITTPTMLLYEFARRLMYVTEGHLDATLGAALVATGYASGVLISAFLTHDALAASMGMGIGGGFGAALIVFRHLRLIGRPGRQGFAQWLRLSGNTCWHLGSFLAHSTYNTALPIVVAAVGTPAAVAALVATRNLTNPALTIASALDSVEKPRASRAYREGGDPALKAAAARTRRFLLAVNLPVLLLLALFAPQLLAMMRFEDVAGHAVLIYWWIPIVLAILLNQPFETVLVVQKRSAVLFAAKATAGGVLLTLAFLLVPRFGASGALYATLMAMLTNLAINAVRATLGERGARIEGGARAYD